MTSNEYQEAALRTESFIKTDMDGSNYIACDGETYRILQGLMGLCGESGECLDELKKTMFQGHELDRYHLARELGDVAWYLAISASALGYSLDTIFEMNISKLKDRYPNKFEPELSVYRNHNDI